MSKTVPAVELEDVSFFYDGPPVLDKVNLTVEEGEFMGVIGPNGSGKTTLLRLLLGLLRPTVGQVRIFGQTPEHARRQIGYVPQKPHLDPDFPIIAEDMVLMGRLGQSRPVGGFRRADYEAAEKALAAVDITSLRRHRFGRLSGGEQRRVLIARALATEPRLLLLDEPTVGVDHRVEHEIYSLLDVLNKQLTIVLVSHDLGCIKEHVRRVACVHESVFCHTPEELTGEVIEAIFGGPRQMAEHHMPGR